VDDFEVVPTAVEAFTVDVVNVDPTEVDTFVDVLETLAKS
jgi:hypothetical protein